MRGDRVDCSAQSTLFFVAIRGVTTVASRWVRDRNPVANSKARADGMEKAERSSGQLLEHRPVSTHRRRPAHPHGR
ncbi:MAG: hypothetical protein ACYTGC_10745, partial [Planctomycetota bacterium]